MPRGSAVAANCEPGVHECQTVDFAQGQRKTLSENVQSVAQYVQHRAANRE
jgi:hypothetical protein